MFEKSSKQERPIIIFPVVLLKQCGVFSGVLEYRYQEMSVHLIATSYFCLTPFYHIFVQKEAESALPSGRTSAKVENVLVWIVFDQQEEQGVSSESRRNYRDKAFFWSPL